MEFEFSRNKTLLIKHLSYFIILSTGLYLIWFLNDADEMRMRYSEFGWFCITTGLVIGLPCLLAFGGYIVSLIDGANDHSIVESGHGVMTPDGVAAVAGGILYSVFAILVGVIFIKTSRRRG